MLNVQYMSAEGVIRNIGIGGTNQFQTLLTVRAIRKRVSLNYCALLLTAHSAGFRGAKSCLCLGKAGLRKSLTERWTK